jgi:hypothetical protein
MIAQASDWRLFNEKNRLRRRTEVVLVCEICKARSSKGKREPGWWYKRVSSTLGLAGKPIHRCPRKECRPAMERPCRRCPNPRRKGYAFCSDACQQAWEREIFA